MKVFVCGKWKWKLLVAFEAGIIEVVNSRRLQLMI